MSTVPDPRPTVLGVGVDVGVDAAGRGVAGTRCGACGHPSLWSTPRCPVCGGATAPAVFGPGGTVWSSTVVRVAVPGRTPPYTLAYVDLDDGPRLLAHVAGSTERLAPGARVRVAGSTADGDVLVEEAP